ncbi:MAG: hypothetical protein ACI4P0_02145, partial [Mailhella sp.]
AWQETLVLRIMDEAGRHADSLGYPGMFKPGNWKHFDEEIVPGLARKLLEELLAGRRDVQRDWNRKIRQFSEEMEQISLLCIDAAILDDGLSSLGEIPFTRERWLVRANSLVKKAGLFAAGFALRRGTGVGLGIVLGNMGWWAVLPVAVAGSLVWTLMKFGSPSRCRRIVMERREEAVRHWAAEQRKRLEGILDQNLQEVTSAYGKVTQEGVMPALSVLAEEISSLKLYMAVLKKIRFGTEERAGRVLEIADRAQSMLQATPCSH